MTVCRIPTGRPWRVTETVLPVGSCPPSASLADRKKEVDVSAWRISIRLRSKMMWSGPEKTTVTTAFPTPGEGTSTESGDSVPHVWGRFTQQKSWLATHASTQSWYVRKSPLEMERTRPLSHMMAFTSELLSGFARRKLMSWGEVRALEPDTYSRQQLSCTKLQEALKVTELPQ
jgi:hypothetical protein